MNKRFNPEANPILDQIIDNIESSLECSKFSEYESIIDIDTWENIKLKMLYNTKIAESGFGFCITNFYEFRNFKRLIVINMENCNRAEFNEKEIGAIILHELGHLLNFPELIPEQNFLYCYTNEIPYNKFLDEEIKSKNQMNMEIYADSYANQNGYGIELLSTFEKQNAMFEQKIGYFNERVASINKKEIFKGNIMPINVLLHHINTITTDSTTSESTRNY